MLNHLEGENREKQDKRIDADSFSDQQRRGRIEKGKTRKLVRTDFCSPQIFKKVRNHPSVIFRGLGEDDSEKIQKKISWHCPF